MAIASGMADGLGTGDNTRSAVITRGLAELTRLGCAMGGSQITFAGLAGMGDLIATCISPQSRNRYVGEQLGRGRKIDEIISEMRSEEHTSELQSLIRISYAVFCLKKKKTAVHTTTDTSSQKQYTQ